jgi:hypothetical protein
MSTTGILGCGDGDFESEAVADSLGGEVIALCAGNIRWQHTEDRDVVVNRELRATI